MPKGSTLRNEWLDHYFLNASIPNVGDVTGLPAAGATADLHVNVYDDEPTGAGAILTYTGYAEQTVVRTGAGWSRSGNVISNVAEINFGTNTDSGTPPVASYVGVHRVGSSTTPDYWSPLFFVIPAPFVVTSTGADNVAIADHGLAVDDQVMFVDVEGAVLGAVSPGTIYYVQAVTNAHLFKISATLGGAALSIAGTPGGGQAQKVVTQPVGEQQSLRFAAGQLQIIEH